MKTHHILVAATLTAFALLTGCASPGYQTTSGYPQQYPTTSTYPAASGYPAGQPSYASSGVVDSIQVVNANTAANTPGGIGAGAVIGGAVGGLLGNQVGSGRGRTAATAAGVVGGAVVGHQIQQQQRAQAAQPQAYQIGIRMDNGSYQTIVQDSVADLQVGNRVRIENGRAYRY